MLRKNNLIPLTAGLSIDIISKEQAVALIKDLELAIDECHKILWEDYSPSKRNRIGRLMDQVDLKKLFVIDPPTGVSKNWKKKGFNYTAM